MPAVTIYLSDNENAIVEQIMAARHDSKEKVCHDFIKDTLRTVYDMEPVTE